MKSVKEILNEYNNGYPELKLNLYLECPELRCDFIQMDLKKKAIKAAHSKQKKNKKIKHKSI
jgi:hypothetical protein